jgi:hypothetical protein
LPKPELHPAHSPLSLLRIQLDDAGAGNGGDRVEETTTPSWVQFGRSETYSD